MYRLFVEDLLKVRLHLAGLVFAYVSSCVSGAGICATGVACCGTDVVHCVAAAIATATLGIGMR